MVGYRTDFATALRSVTLPTERWRANAVRVNRNDGERIEFQYVEAGKEGALVRRRLAKYLLDMMIQRLLF